MEDFYNSLTVMWKGMLSIFVAILVIMIVVFILTKIPERKKEEQDN